MREQQLLSRWRRKASGTARRSSVAARAELERPPASRRRLNALVLLLALTSRAAFAGGNPVTVTTLLDDETPGDGKCSLREAIKNINAQGEMTQETVRQVWAASRSTSTSAAPSC
jgi:CSLREA domain-containing protein